MIYESEFSIYLLSIVKVRLYLIITKRIIVSVTNYFINTKKPYTSIYNSFYFIIACDLG